MRPPPKDIYFVATQLLLLIGYLFRIGPIDFQVSAFTRYASLFFVAIGAILLALSAIRLNKNLTPFPSPKQSGLLITSGIYKYIRHPIYTGILLLTAGYGVYSENTLRILVFGSLLVLFLFKAKYEESQLIKKFPEYKAYKKQTPALMPGIY